MTRCLDRAVRLADGTGEHLILTFTITRIGEDFGTQQILLPGAAVADKAVKGHRAPVVFFVQIPYFDAGFFVVMSAL
jgi:hypothetical protein